MENHFASAEFVFWAWSISGIFAIPLIFAPESFLTENAVVKLRWRYAIRVIDCFMICWMAWILWE